MTLTNARRVVGNQPLEMLRATALALALHSGSNTPEDWARLEAACVVLGRRTPGKARRALKAHRAARKPPVDD